MLMVFWEKEIWGAGKGEQNPGLPGVSAGTEMGTLVTCHAVYRLKTVSAMSRGIE